MADEQALARVRMWWQTIEPDTQMMFDKLYRQHPESVLDAISGGTLTDLNGAATLDEALTYTGDGANVFADRQAVPTIYIKDGAIIIDPPLPGENEPITVRWTEVNEGAQSEGHITTVAWFVNDAWVDPIQEVIAAPMGAGEVVERSVALPGVPTGIHQIYVTANADGNVTGAGAVPPAGIGMTAGVAVHVGERERPSDPGDANLRGVTDALEYLNSAIAAVSDPSSLTYAAQALYSYAGSLDTGGEATGERFNLVQPDQKAIEVVQRAQALEAVSADDYAYGSSRWHSELLEAATGLGRITDPLAEGGEAAFEAMSGLGRESFGI